MLTIPHDHVTADRLIKALAFYGYETAEDSDPRTFHIRSETGIPIQLHIPEDQPFIQVTTKHLISDSIQVSDRLKLVNDISTRMHLCSFFLDDKSEIVALFYQPFLYGLIMPQFLSNLKRFSFINRTIWHEHDWKDVITPYLPAKPGKTAKSITQTQEAPTHETCH